MVVNEFGKGFINISTTFDNYSTIDCKMVDWMFTNIYIYNRNSKIRFCYSHTKR